MNIITSSEGLMQHTVSATYIGLTWCQNLIEYTDYITAEACNQLRHMYILSVPRYGLLDDAAADHFIVGYHDISRCCLGAGINTLWIWVDAA